MTILIDLATTFRLRAYYQTASLRTRQQIMVVETMRRARRMPLMPGQMCFTKFTATFLISFLSTYLTFIFVMYKSISYSERFNL